jgi:hypothetical protein
MPRGTVAYWRFDAAGVAVPGPDGTLGKPFVIGGTQFAEQFGQGFYGWIGDIRVVSRALRPDQFLTAV